MQNSPDWSNAALILVDPLVDLLSPESVIWDIVGPQVEETGLLAKLVRLRAAAEAAGIPVMYSRVEVTEEDYASMSCRSGLQSLMADRRMCVPGKGGRYHPDLEPNDRTILLAPRKGPSAAHSDFAVQMRRRGLDTAIFTGMIANLCVESHVRDAIEEGFSAYVVRDAIGALSADSLEATCENFALHATGMVTTTEVLASFSALQPACPA